MIWLLRTLDIHSNEAWNHYDYILIKLDLGQYRVHTKVELMTLIQQKMLQYFTIWSRWETNFSITFA